MHRIPPSTERHFSLPLKENLSSAFHPSEALHSSRLASASDCHYANLRPIWGDGMVYWKKHHDDDNSYYVLSPQQGVGTLLSTLHV